MDWTVLSSFTVGVKHKPDSHPVESVPGALVLGLNWDFPEVRYEGDKEEEQYL